MHVPAKSPTSRAAPKHLHPDRYRMLRRRLVRDGFHIPNPQCACLNSSKGSSTAQKDRKNSSQIGQLGDYARKALDLHLFTRGGDEERDTGHNRKSCHLLPAASIIYFHSIFPPRLCMPWEGVAGVGFPWDPTCARCSASLPGRL